MGWGALTHPNFHVVRAPVVLLVEQLEVVTPGGHEAAGEGTQRSEPRASLGKPPCPAHGRVTLPGARGQGAEGGVCSPVPLLRGFAGSGGHWDIPVPTSSAAPSNHGSGVQPSPTCLLGRSEWSLPTAQGGQSQQLRVPDPIPRGDPQGHTHRRGLETWELNLVNSPGAVHSVPSWEGRGSVRAAGHHTKAHQPPVRGINPKEIQG